MAEDDRTFRTSTPAANRAEMQGLGVGRKEMDAQRAPSRERQADWSDETDEGVAHSSDHTRRPIKTEAERGQGRKTRQATKDIISRRST